MSPIPGVANAVVALTYDWSISISSFQKVKRDQFVESSQFPKDSANSDPKWCLRAYPRGTSKFSSNYNLVLATVLRCMSNVSACVRVSILNTTGEQMYTYNLNNQIFGPQSISYVELPFYLTTYGYDTLNILVEIGDVTNICNFPRQSNIPQTKLSVDLETLLDNEKFSDVKLVAGGHELKAHKGILAVRSKVYAAMFEHEMKEQSLNRVYITDVDHEVLKEMLRYMYTGRAPNLDTMAEKLFATADKYDINDLKIMCEESLGNNINIEKAANTLILAHRHNAEMLKSQTIDFIIRNAKSFMETEGWKHMRTTHSHLIAVILCYCTKCNN